MSKPARANGFISMNPAHLLIYNIDNKNPKSLSKSLNTLLKNVKGKPEQQMVETLTVRSMAKAVYTINNIGHYGLAFDYYSHFTSPIRRYPDLIVHRLIEKSLSHHVNPNEVGKYFDILEENSFIFDQLNFQLNYLSYFYLNGNLVDVEIEESKMKIFLNENKDPQNPILPSAEQCKIGASPQKCPICHKSQDVHPRKMPTVSIDIVIIC